MNETLAEFKRFEEIEQVKYTNLYYIKNKFYYFTTKKNIDLWKILYNVDLDEDKNINLKSIKTLGCPEHTGRINEEIYIIKPTIKYFENYDKLNKYIEKLNCKEYKKPTLYFSHYYQHNIGHGLYDALYPIYLCYLSFFNNAEYETFNMFVNILIDPGGWCMPKKYIPTRWWVLNIFKDFCFNGELIIRPKNNIKFNTLISGSWRGGISSVNKRFVMYGKDIFGLEKFRNRFLKIYNIKSIVRNKINIGIINSERYTKEERKNLHKIVNVFSDRKDAKIFYIDWKEIPKFKNQIEFIYNCDIHISGCGTSMMNFPFLKKNSIHINLGTFFNKSVYSLMETNICLLSNEIYCENYNIYKHKKILYHELKNMIDKNIYNFKNKIFLKSELPIYTKKWQEFCKKNPKKADVFIKRLRGETKPNWIGNRYPDTIILYIPKIYN